MQTKAATNSARSAADMPRRRSHGRRGTASLAVRYADALYRPVPPVGFDADGYPDEDAAPMENWPHDETCAYLKMVVKGRFRDDPRVCVAGNLGLFFERGNRGALIVPDMMVAFDVDPNNRRRSYKVWEERKVPDIAVEVLSPTTVRKDIEAKPDLYRALGVREHWIIDLFELKPPPPITGWRLTAGGYEAIRPGPSGGLMSDVLGLELVMAESVFRLRDPATGELLPYYDELVQAKGEAEQAKLEAEQATQAAEQAKREAEARAAAAEAELEALRSRPARRQA